MKDLPFYPHLGMTEEQFGTICEELFTADPVLLARLAQIEDLEKKLKDYDERQQGFEEDVRRIEAREDAIKAELKSLDRQRREARGQVSQMVYHTSVGKARIRQTQNAIERRKRQLYLAEARRRLGQLGKELKLHSGRRASKGLPAVVIDKNETQTAQ